MVRIITSPWRLGDPSLKIKRLPKLGLGRWSFMVSCRAVGRVVIVYWATA